MHFDVYGQRGWLRPAPVIHQKKQNEERKDASSLVTVAVTAPVIDLPHREFSVTRTEFHTSRFGHFYRVAKL
jgi:hypothetical protein